MLRWYLIHTKPSGEAVAVANLERQGYEVYLPRVVQTVRGAGRPKDRLSVLFPRYLFLRLHEGIQALAPVASTLGVTGIVRFGARYIVVPDKVVRDLRARADPETGLHHLTCSSPLVPGARVKICSGTFDGLEGVFERAVGRDRVVVLLQMLGRTSEVCVFAESIMLGQSV